MNDARSGQAESAPRHKALAGGCRHVPVFHADWALLIPRSNDAQSNMQSLDTEKP